MGTIGGSEILIILLVVIIFFGAKKIPELARSLGLGLKEFKKANAGNIKEELLKSAVEVNNIRFIAQEVDMEADDMKNVSFSLRKEENLVMVLAAKVGGKALLTVMLTDDLVAKGINAGAMIRDIAKEINGGGGGQAFFATAGGTNANGIRCLGICVADSEY